MQHYIGVKRYFRWRRRKPITFHYLSPSGSIPDVDPPDGVYELDVVDDDHPLALHLIYSSELRTIKDHMLEAKRHLAAYLDEARYITRPDDTDATTGDRKWQLLINAVDEATRVVANSQLASDTRKSAASCRLPLPPPWQRPSVQYLSRCDDATTQNFTGRLSALAAQINWLSDYVRVAIRSNDDVIDDDVTDDRPRTRRSSSSFRHRGRRNRTETARRPNRSPRPQPEVIKELWKVDKSLLGTLSMTLGNVLALVNIAHEEINALFHQGRTTPLEVAVVGEVPWLLDGPECRWSVESYGILLLTCFSSIKLC